MLHSLVVVGDHFQVLVGDSRYGPTIDTTHLWDFANGVAFIAETPQLIAIPTVRYGGIVNIELEFLSGNNRADDLPGWDSIGDFKLEVESGELLLWGPEAENLDTAARVSCNPGPYIGVALSFGTKDVTDELSPDGPDRYRIRMWKVV